MINETDCLAALSHGAIRSIFLGNHALRQNMFLLNPSSVNKTLFFRIKDAINLEEVSNNMALSSVASPTKSSPKKRSAKKQQTAAAPIVVSTEPRITFVDSSVSTEQDKKGSFENYEEANSVADYLNAFKDKLDFDDLAIMSPLRT